VNEPSPLSSVNATASGVSSFVICGDDIANIVVTSGTELTVMKKLS
jgi:hypothetical protein